MASGSKDAESAILQRLEEMQMSQKKEAKYIKTYLSKLNNTNKAIEKKVDEIKESNAEMREKVQSLEKRIDPIERERRQKNILIYGLKEEQNETWQALENMVLNTFQNQMKINIQLHEIDRIKRVGRKVSSEGRLVIVTLTTIRRKIDIIRNRRELRGTTVRIQEDFTKEVVEARKRLYPQLKMMREKGRKAVMRYDKLYIDGVVWNGGNNEEKEEVRQKRKPSESPEVRTENGGKDRQVKRKPNAQHYEMNSDEEEEDMEFYTDSEEFNHEDTTQETLLQIEKQLMNTSPQGLVYFNPSYNPHTWFEVFEETLDKVESAHTGCNFILCGDFNSRIGDLQDEEDTIFEDTILEARRNSLDKTVNTRGRLLLDLFEKHALYCLNGRSPGDIPDLVEYLKQNGVNGVTVDSTFRMIALMYADDLVLLAESDEEMQNMLNVFHRYCQEKQLIVNVDKTKIMIFRRKGRVSKKYKFTMGRDTLEIVSQYIYLGVLFTAQACFRENAKRVVNKTSSATSVVNSIWAKSRTHCWEAKQTVYKAMVKSVLMYAAEVWGARYVEQLEMAQVRYFKYMFLWPRNTPNYMVRQECGVSATSVELFRKMLGWWIKMLEMPEDRYPKICYNVLKEMEERSPLDTTHNWAAQLRERLLGLEYEQLYQEGTSRDIKNELENIIQKFEKKSKEEDNYDTNPTIIVQYCIQGVDGGGRGRDLPFLWNAHGQNTTSKSA
ncbi:hypothetical protein M8J77_002623 [Diaphorina citri]|nr:hypothetical protein M8J77_002623 [Diaphorina citri]